MSDVTILSIVNSFSIISDEDNSLWIDPWVNPANAGAWAPLIENQEYSRLDEIFLNTPPDWVFISHMHTDHYDCRFLKHIKNKNPNVKFLIKDFSSKVFYKKITGCIGIESVNEVKEFSEIKLSNFSILVIPQYNNSTSNEPSAVAFDLDTSLIIKTKYGIIFNEIDNPLKLDDYPIIYDQLPSQFHEKPKVALLGFSSASEYPQSYLDIDRSLERSALVNRSLERFYKVGQFLSASVVIPAGGDYRLNGFLDDLNKYTAVPNFNEIMSKQAVDSQSNVINPSKQYIKLTQDGPQILDRLDGIPKCPSVNPDFLIEEYFLSDKNIISSQEVQAEIMRLELQADNRLRNLFKNLKTTITIHATSNFPRYSENSIIDEDVIFKHTLFGGGLSEISLDIYCSYKLLWCMLSSQESWNDLYFLCLIRRFPNVYEPDAVRALNFYKISRLKMS